MRVWQSLQLSTTGHFKPVPLVGEAAARSQQAERRLALKRIGLAALGSMQLMMYTVALYAGALQGIDEGWQQQLAIAQQHHIKKWCQGLGVGGEYRPTAENDRIVVAALGRPDRDALLLEQVEQHRTIQLPAQGEPEQIAVAMGRITLVGEETAHIHIGALRQGGPNHLIAQAGDPHGVGAGEGQHGPQRPSLRLGGFKEQGFLVQVVLLPGWS